jgi:hypothetical protein
MLRRAVCAVALSSQPRSSRAWLLCKKPLMLKGQLLTCRVNGVTRHAVGGTRCQNSSKRRSALKGCITSLRNDGIGRHVFESGEVPTIVHSASGDINSNGVPVPFAHRSKLIRKSALLLSCTVGFSGISNTVVSGFSYLLCVSQGAKSIIQMLYRPLFQVISRSIFADCPLGMG